MNWTAVVRSLVAGSIICGAGVAAERRPNIVLILSDDVGREVLGCYGGSSYGTPQIDRLTAGGRQYAHAYVMPVCHPTRTTLLTGQYPCRLGRPNWGSFPREAEQRTLAATLQRAGYAVGVAGKWQLALLKDDLEQPHRLGFDEYCLYGWHEGPWYYQPHIWQNGKLRRDIRDSYGPDVICDYLIDFIDRNKNRPFFAFYPMSLCHAETNDLDRPAPVGPNGRYDSYAEMVAKMDERVGRIVAALDRFGVRRNTLVLFTSDNGTAASTLIDVEGDKLIYAPVISKMGDREITGGKATLSDWGTRVPLIASWPGIIGAGEVSDDLVDASDFLPSLAALTAAPLPAGVNLDGQRTIAPAGRDAAPRKWVFAEHEGKCFVRNRQWKLYGDGRLFDMDADPAEQAPLNVSRLPDAAADAYGELQQALAELPWQDSGPNRGR